MIRLATSHKIAKKVNLQFGYEIDLVSNGLTSTCSTARSYRLVKDTQSVTIYYSPWELQGKSVRHFENFVCQVGSRHNIYFVPIT